MGGGSSPPALQNPAVTANYQTGLNTASGLESQLGSMVNQNNPYGSINYNQTGSETINVPGYGDVSIPTYTSNVNLSPQQQSLFKTSEGTQQITANQGQNLINNMGYGSVNPAEAIGTEASGLTGQMMNQWLQSQEPWMNLQDEQTRTQLLNEGLDPNNPAYQNQMGQLEQAQAQGVAGAAAQFQPTAFSEAENQYTLPLTMGLQEATYGQASSPTSQALQTPGLSVSPANYEGDVTAYQNEQEQAYQAQQQMMGALYSGLLGAAGNVAGAGIRSDRRLKTDITIVGTLPNGLNVYSFKFKGFDWQGPQIGLMADEVEKIHPEAVEYDLGYKFVNYELAVR